MSLRFLPGNYGPGVVVAVPMMTQAGIVLHKGILADGTGWDGYPTVVHNSKLYGTALETTMTEYARGARGPVRSEGYPGRLPRWRVLQNARSMLGLPWRLEQNCEHFVSLAHGLVPNSPQLKAGAGKAALIALAATLFFL
ncbi:MAG TPA: hypothetical protein VEK07_02675 [Polyangiaceae bacterium]|nr:hypothetical protein [Polyangiaceae bacterium]